MLYDKSLWIKIYELSKRLLHIYKKCIPLTVFTMSKVHEKSAFQRTRTKLTLIVIKSYTLPTIWNRICYNLCYIMINIPIDFYNINKEKLEKFGIHYFYYSQLFWLLWALPLLLFVLDSHRQIPPWLF